MAAKINVSNTNFTEVEADVLIILINEEDASKAQLRRHESYADAVRLNILEELLNDPRAKEEFKGKKGEILSVYAPKDAKVARVVFAGIGSSSHAGIEEVHRAVSKAIAVIDKLPNINKVALGCRSKCKAGPVELFGAIAKATVMSHYQFEHYKTKKSYTPYQEVIIVAPDVTKDAELGEVHNEVQAQYVVGTSANYCRDLANLRAEEGTPSYYANQIIEMSKQFPKLVVHVLDLAKLQELGMGLIVGVGKGSKNPPCVVLMEYQGDSTTTEWNVALVGKGITYDSGGLHLKSSAHDMHGDMAGSSAVMGAMRSAVALRIKKNVIGAVAFAENMISRDCVRSGDILKSYDGRTVEIKNTDAEGRLVLADTIAYVCDKYKPSSVVDIATLTGSCAQFLGDNVAGVWSRPQEVGFSLIGASANLMEPVWPEPLRDEYDVSLKSDAADMSNSMAPTGPRKCGANVAALFISRFVPETVKNFVHLDIAGCSEVGSKSWLAGAEGSSGYGVGLLLHLAKVL